MILVYGGSFDPPHLGHLNIVRALKERFQSAFKILIYPNAISPLKKEKSLRPSDILKLCEFTFKELLDEQIEIRETELFSATPSYTIFTIRQLRTEFPEEQIWLCIGEDSLADFSHWHEIEELKTKIHTFVILRRKTRSPLPISFPSSELENKSIVLDNELWDISSTRLRQEREFEYAKRWMEASSFSFLQNQGWFT